MVRADPETFAYADARVSVSAPCVQPADPVEQHADTLVVHDPARALTPVEVIRSVIDTVTSGAAAAAVAAQPVTDTIKLADPADLVHSTWDRRYLRVLQAPLCYRPRLIGEPHCSPAPEDFPPDQIRIVPGHPLGLRLDNPENRIMAAALRERE